MASMILISVLAISMILCLTMLIRWILGDRRSSEQQSTTTTETITTAIVQAQAAHTQQIGELLARHSSDLAQVLHAQSDYINRFLNGPTMQASPPNDNPIQPGEGFEWADPGTWDDQQQLEALPKQIRDEILRERSEQTEQQRLSAPSHNIHYDPRVPVIVPGLSSEEQPPNNDNGSWTMFDGPEG